MDDDEPEKTSRKPRGKPPTEAQRKAFEHVGTKLDWSEWRAQKDQEAEAARAVDRKRANELADRLAGDASILRAWVEGRGLPVRAAEGLAASVRDSAQALVQYVGGQGRERERLEDRVNSLLADLAVQTDHIKRIGSSEPGPEGLQVLKRWELTDRSKTVPEDLPDWAMRTESHSELEAAIQELRSLRSSGFDQFNAACDAASEAANQARITARSAMWRSARTFRSSPVDWSTSSVRAAIALLVAFLGVAAAGTVLAPTEALTAIAVFVLAVPSALAVYFAVRDTRRRATIVAAIGAATSFSMFEAAYLISNWYDPKSITIAGNQISLIGEAALLSLTVGVGTGTLNVDLAGPARAIAFVQILLTITAVVAGITWGWDRLVAHVDQSGEPTSQG